MWGRVRLLKVNILLNHEFCHISNFVLSSINLCRKIVKKILGRILGKIVKCCRGRGIATLFLTEAEANRGIVLLTEAGAEAEEKSLFLGETEAEAEDSVDPCSIPFFKKVDLRSQQKYLI